jgi:hypothetical protein
LHRSDEFWIAIRAYNVSYSRILAELDVNFGKKVIEGYAKVGSCSQLQNARLLAAPAARMASSS